ncbi:MAG TPA: baseplate J/gp47 family protein [Pyrinomonadaceae bacterium]|nr:baseplate J/gp47 family protein [Pyrinomonadaceae bacterium]
MSFVAQPYERFVDDLLTALTGGVTREEHQFIGIDQSYALASPGVIASSLKVFGHRNNQFVLFEGGIDYSYNADQEAIVWTQNGKVPDDHSYFYANYYLQEGARRLTDRNPGSVTTTLGEAFAREFAVVHKQMQMIYESAFVDLATGTSLDHVAALLSLTRKDAKFAGGEVLFRRNTPAEGDIAVPPGTLVSTDQGQNFETTDKRTLRKGQLSVVAAIRAQVEGPPGRVEASTIKNINRPIFGIESVSNEGPTFFATEKETDEELRRRIKGTLERAGKSTLNSIKFSLIEEIPGINEGNVQVSESAGVPGRVEVKFGLGSTVDPDLVRSIEETIFNSRPAGVRVVHNLPTRSESGAAATTPSQNGNLTRESVVADFDEKEQPSVAVQLPADVLAGMPEGIVDLQVEVLLRLSEGNLSVPQKENIEDGVRTAVADFIEAIPMGADLIYNKLLGRVVESDEVADAILLVGAAGRSNGSANTFYNSNLATDGRKAKVEINNVYVGLMGETILIDVLVLVEDAPNGGTPNQITPELTTAVENSIRSALTGVSEKLLKTDLRGVISSAITAQAPGLQLIDGNPVVINAQYEESGRLLNNTDEVSVEAHQVLKLGTLRMEEQGELDG